MRWVMRRRSFWGRSLRCLILSSTELILTRRQGRRRETQRMATGSTKKRKPKRSSVDSPTHMAGPTRSGRAACLPCALLALSALLLLFATWKLASSLATSPPTRFYSFEIVNEFPHDADAFTQGLLYGGNDTLFESTGLYHRSSVRQVHLRTGKVQVIYQMDGSFFGEGLTLLGERLFQVTWLEKIGFVYDRYNFSKQEKFTHPMRDGWGLATDGEVIFGSDGSSTLYQLDPETWKVLRSTVVKYQDREVPYLNELEHINGEVWANIWQTDCIARISHKDGLVLGWILLHELRQGLLTSGYTGVDVLNGIAWDEEQNRLFLTGKLWPKLYEIKLQQIPGPLNGRIDGLCPIM